jgi:hypothetical protein
MHHRTLLAVTLIAVWLVVAVRAPLAAQEATPASPTPGTGAITGRVTDEATGQPVADVYLTIGYKGIKLAAITDADGRYRVPDVPAGQPADVFGFHDGGYRYHNSIYDDHLKIVLEPGQTYTYDFTVRQLNDPSGEPEVRDPAMSPQTAEPGQEVTFEVTARGGKGGLSDEVFAASPDLGRLALLTPIGGDRFRGALTIPRGTEPGDYSVAFFAASNECYDNRVFPMLTLHVEQG